MRKEVPWLIWATYLKEKASVLQRQTCRIQKKNMENEETKQQQKERKVYNP